MDSKATIKTQYNNQTIELTFSETFLLYSRETEVTITLPHLNWSFQLVFGKDLEGFENLGSALTIEGTNIKITYNNWNGNEVQNKQLQFIESAGHEIQVYYALKTTTSEIDNRRTITFSVWKVIP